MLVLLSTRNQLCDASSEDEVDSAGSRAFLRTLPAAVLDGVLKVHLKFEALYRASSIDSVSLLDYQAALTETASSLSDSIKHATVAVKKISDSTPPAGATAEAIAAESAEAVIGAARSSVRYSCSTDRYDTGRVLCLGCLLFAVAFLFTAINEVSCVHAITMVINGCYYILVLMAAMASVLYGLVLTNDVMWDGTIERLVKLEYDANARYNRDRKKPRTAGPASSPGFVRKHSAVLKHSRFKVHSKSWASAQITNGWRCWALLYSIRAAVSVGLVFAQNYGIIALPRRQEG